MKLGNKKTQHDLEEKGETIDVEISRIGADNTQETSRNDQDLNEQVQERDQDQDSAQYEESEGGSDANSSLGD